MDANVGSTRNERGKWLDERTDATGGRADGVDLAGIPIAPFHVAWGGTIQALASATSSSSGRTDADADIVQPDAGTCAGHPASIVER